MNETHLNETLEQVINLIPRYSWEIMDEPQKDAVMAKIVLPRYDAITSDGTKLGPTTWAAILGTTASAVKNRVYRLKQARKPDAETVAGARQKADDIRRAKRVLADPASRSAIVESMPIEVKVQIAKSLAQTPASAPISGKRIQDSKAVVAPLERMVNSVVAKLGTVSLIDQATAEINEAVAKNGLDADAMHAIEEAIERLVAAVDFAKEMGGVK